MIDRTLFAVKVLQDVGTETTYVITRIFRSFRGAFRYRQGILGKRHRGAIVAPRIIHPADWVVNAYLSYGNTIYD